MSKPYIIFAFLFALLPLSAAAETPKEAAIRQAFRDHLDTCRKPPEGTPSVDLQVELDAGGVIRRITLTPPEKPRYGKDSAFRKAADDAIAALLVCGKVRGLPESSYSLWKSVTLTFAPARQAPPSATAVLNRGVIPADQIH